MKRHRVGEGYWEGSRTSQVGVQWEGVILNWKMLMEWEWPRESEGMASSVSAVLYFSSSTLSDYSCQAFD